MSILHRWPQILVSTQHGIVFFVFPQNYPGLPTQATVAVPGPTVLFLFVVRSLLSILPSPLLSFIFSSSSLLNP